MNNADAIFSHARSAPERIALRDSAGASWTYATLRDRVAAVAARLAHQGVRRGDRVLLIAPSVPEFAAAYYGIHAAGAIAVTANTMAPAPELEYLASDAGVALVLGWPSIGRPPEAAAAALGVPYQPLTPDLLDGPGVSEPYRVEADDTATILYTSGTTGRPKGAQLTHGNLIACADVFVKAHQITPEDRGGTALPLFHIYGQACVMGTALRAGASLSLLERFEPRAMYEMLQRDRLTFVAGVPTMWNALLRADLPDFSGLRYASSGGASLPAEVMRAFHERFG
ncbi:class I adenylate-forming enzyme family protein, partial [Nocardia aurea]|uniref:class I adenylate-forming enzyme family protein n=1 Tax=Nocardia aurea TaxID=2144174 RepID=UPI0013008E4C